MFVKSHFLIDHVHLVIATIVILEIKHFVFDYVLQTPYMFLNKGKYGHPGGILHAGLHAFGSCPIFIFLTPSLKLAFAMIVSEFIVHYHTDWSKEQIQKRGGLTYVSAEYWWVFGLDQLIHHLTYVVMVAVLIWGLGFG